MNRQVALDGTWKLKGFDPGMGDKASAWHNEYQDENWVDAGVPGDVHSALLAAGAIPDPFADDNADRLRWVEDQEWWYRKEFSFSRVGKTKQRVNLVFDGLDTLAAVWLNGKLLGSHANMFTPAAFDVTDIILEGSANVISVRLEPVEPYISAKDSSRFWAAFGRQRMWIRKCQMNWGWDWAPRLITAGIWRSVRLEILDSPKIADVYVKTMALSGGGATVEVQVSVDASAGSVSEDGGGSMAVAVELGGQRRDIEAARQLAGPISMIFYLESPRLWWTHDLGEPYLYELKTSLLQDGGVIDSRMEKVGLRTIEILEEPDPVSGGKYFTICLNGRKVFCKGANWVPADSLVARVDQEKYRRLIDLAKAANMNMLRVWGGGIYEHEEFYRACDEAGLLIWQDFMFACASYPDFDDAFMREVEEEARYVVTRLRNHPSLALWCGNNENEWIDCRRCWNQPDRPFYGRRIYHEIIPAICASLDPGRPYRPSSPYGGNDYNSELEGDKHNWQVWVGQIYPHRFGEEQTLDLTPEGVSYRNYSKENGRFISEFGIQGSPVLATLQAYIKGRELVYDGPAFLSRIKDTDLTRKERMLAAHTGLPKNLDAYITLSMLTQAEGLKYGVEHFRRRKFACSGSLVWQLNDCWPGISWSVLDYLLIPKASYHYLQRAYSPLLLSFAYGEGEMVSLWGINDTNSSWSGVVELGCMDFNGQSRSSTTLQVSLPGNTSQKLLDVGLRELGVIERSKDFIYARPFGDDRIQGNHCFLKEHKDLQLPAARLRLSYGYDSITMTTDAFARFVHVPIADHRIILSDNYFDLFPGEERTVQVNGLDSMGSSPREMKVKWINCTNSD